MDKKKIDGITDSLLTKATGIRTFQLLADVTAYLEGELADWPANIQDRILEALERKAKEVELPLMIVYSACGKDEFADTDKFFVYVVASEIVVADDRFFQDEKAKLKHIIADIVAGRRLH